ncbi:dynein axonemal intermediate chain 4 isoform X2 [Pungitius pungitius]|uniref:dynein axonemal intermediate chain 4 isoform X2 n=1 Tax=Pungitius pungitius TaxID=134920 RepID=UPI002E13E1C3
MSGEERKKRRTLVLRPSSRTTNVSVSGIHGGHQSTRDTNSITGGSSRKHFRLGGGSKVLEKSALQVVRVFDEEDNDVTPQPLYQADPAAPHAKSCRLFLDEISAGLASEQTTATGSFAMPFSRSMLGSSRISSQSTIESMNEETEDTFSKRQMPISFPDVQRRRDTVKDHVAEDMLKEVYISETDSISLLDMASTFVSVEAAGTEAIMEKNHRYADLCRSRVGNDKYVDRAVQTLNGAAKNKQVQTNSHVGVDSAITVTSWDIYDTLTRPEQHKEASIQEQGGPEYPGAAVDPNRGAERSASVGSTASTVSAASSWNDGALGSGLNAESDLQLILLSEKFRHSLLVMERTIQRNTFQPELAAYKQLSEESLVKPGTVEKRQDDTESPRSPAMERLWAFSCQRCRGRSISTMAWNQKNPWPEWAVHCDSAVTSLDFSSSNPSQLAVGMQDGTIAVYNVNSDHNASCVLSSSQCPNRHLDPVWQLRWTQQELNLTRDKAPEFLFSVAADGRISRWFFCSSGLDCTDLMKLKKIQHTKKKAGGTRTESVLSALNPGLCLDFHPTDSSVYLVGTWEGLIHKCSCSNNRQVLETYRTHFCPVNRIKWSPFSPGVFLSCSSDWTIQLWQQDHQNPVLGFSSTHTAVCDVEWSPKWATVFGAVHEGQLEIWDLSSSILDPVLVQPAAAGVQMTSLLFATQTDCVLVGDSDGQVTIYQLKNLRMGGSNQVDLLEGLIRSAGQNSFKKCT